MSAPKTVTRFYLILDGLALAIRLEAASPPAGVPAAGRLLPADTLFLVSIPDCDKAVAFVKESAPAKLWQDPALTAFKERLAQRWIEDFQQPLERQLGIKFLDYLDLLHGQLTFALTQNGWTTRPDAKPGLLLLLDTKDKQDALKARL